MNMSHRGLHAEVHPSSELVHARASNVTASYWTLPSERPQCSTSADSERCELWVPSPAFGLPTENEKKVAAKLHGQSRGEEGWAYVKTEQAAKPGWIVVRRTLPKKPTDV
jgi:hypothetical protein